MKQKTGKKFEDFVKIVRDLREKCPWDREQTIESLKPYLVEELYEAIQSIDEKNYRKLCDELGDMLLHIVMLSVFAREDSHFSVDDVIDSIFKKMVRRHPHVFAKGSAKTKEEIWKKWEEIKAKEAKAAGRKRKGILYDIPRSLPALCRAEQVQRRAARVGFDWDQVAGAWDKVHEELDEVHELLDKRKKPKACISSKKSEAQKARLKEEIGDLLFAIVNVSRKLNIDAEDALQQANHKFMHRFSKIESRLAKEKLSIEQMDKIWDNIKASET